jgi:hypothetical protein
MTAHEQALLATATLSAIVSVSLMLYLVALRFVAWDLVPASALNHINWWRRHARPCLWTTLTITAAALATMVLVRLS